MPRAGNGRGGIDLAFEVQIATAQSHGEPMRLSLSSTRHAWWSFAQMLVHHTENGCAMAPPATRSTAAPTAARRGPEGCLMEITHAGRQPTTLPNGEQRAMLEDGDTVNLRA